MADWFVWQNVLLPRGRYRIRAAYLGVAAFEDASLRRSSRFADCWPGTARSDWRTFEIVGLRPSTLTSERIDEAQFVRQVLPRGEPRDGIIATLDLLPRGSRYFLGEELQPVVYVENVGEELLFLDRALPHSQGDDLEVRSTAGIPVQHSRTMGTGYPGGLRLRRASMRFVTLPPSARPLQNGQILAGLSSFPFRSPRRESSSFSGGEGNKGAPPRVSTAP
jgi:hypothetical protein